MSLACTKSWPGSFLALASPLLVTACAGLPAGSAAPRVARLPSAEIARPAPEAPGLLPDDLLAMSVAGALPDAVLAHFRQSGAHFDLTPAQIVDLYKRGLPMLVLQAIHDDHEKALRADLTQLLVERDQKCSAETEQARDEERQRTRRDVDPFRSGCYGVWGAFPYRRPGAFMGW